MRSLGEAPDGEQIKDTIGEVDCQGDARVNRDEGHQGRCATLSFLVCFLVVASTAQCDGTARGLHPSLASARAPSTDKRPPSFSLTRAFLQDACRNHARARHSADPTGAFVATRRLIFER